MRIFQSSPTPVLALIAICGCATPATLRVDPLAAYERALADTNPARIGWPGLESQAEARAMEDFIDFYREFSSARVLERVRILYAAKAYFRDPFKEVAGLDAIEEYFLSSTAAIEECRFDIQDWSGHSGEYYLRWVMTLRLARYRDDPPVRVTGMSHVRFDPKGQVIFHQDYWDAAGTVYERFPVVGWILRRIRSGM